MDAQAGQRLCYLQTPEDRFSHVEAHIKKIILVNHLNAHRTEKICGHEVEVEVRHAVISPSPLTWIYTWILIRSLAVYK